MKIYSFEVQTDVGSRIYSIEVQTDAGRRVIKLDAPIDVDPTATSMPPQFRSLTDVLWHAVHQVAMHGAELRAAAPKAEA